MLAAPADARVPRGFVGITADDVFAGNDNYRTANLSAMAAIGVQTIRQTFDWSTIERRRGVYDFSYHDAYVAKAAAHGIRVLPVLFNPPAFYRPTRGRAACAPRKMATFARFAKAVARRYGRRGTLWKRTPRGAEEPNHRVPDLERAQPEDLLVQPQAERRTVRRDAPHRRPGD